MSEVTSPCAQSAMNLRNLHGLLQQARLGYEVPSLRPGKSSRITMPLSAKLSPNQLISILGKTNRQF